MNKNSFSVKHVLDTDPEDEVADLVSTGSAAYFDNGQVEALLGKLGGAASRENFLRNDLKLPI